MKGPRRNRPGRSGRDDLHTAILPYEAVLAEDHDRDRSENVADSGSPMEVVTMRKDCLEWIRLHLEDKKNVTVKRLYYGRAKKE